MKRVLWFCVLVATGYLVAKNAGISGLEDSETYLFVITCLLAVGLYGSAFTIDLAEARQHMKIIVAAVTIGVVFKAAIIGTAMVLITGDVLFAVIGIAVAQIDPLSVAAVLNNSRMSTRAKSILAAWASFDDPVTALLVVYGAAIFAQLAGFTTGFRVLDLSSYSSELFWNLVLAGGAFCCWYLVRRSTPLLCLTVVAVAAIAVERFLMLGIAISGLFLRPPIGGVVTRVVQVAFFVAAAMLGLMLVEGVTVIHGVLLGVVAFAAQIIAGLLLTRGLPKHDRLHLAFAQQNGITAIILSLLLEIQFGGVVAVVAPAIVTVNVVHALANSALDRYMQDVNIGQALPARYDS